MKRPKPVKRLPPTASNPDRLLRGWLQSGGRWGYARLLGLALAVLAYLVFCWVNFHVLIPSENSGALAVARYLLPPLAGISGALFSGARYVREVYGLARLRTGLRHLARGLFSLAIPSARIQNGKVDIRRDPEKLLEKIGGPGTLSVEPGVVVALERLTGHTRIVEAGSYLLQPFERIGEVFSLDEQGGKIDRIATFTRDGIEVEVSEVKLRYRLKPERASDAGEGTRDDDCLVYAGPGRSLAYRCLVAPDGQNSWDRSIQLIITQEITGWINARTLDELTAPGLLKTDPKSPPRLVDPRTEIQRLLSGPGVRAALDRFGTDLVGCDIGRFQVKDRSVEEQRLRIWQSLMGGQAEIERSQSQQRRLIEQQIGRAEGQAQVVLSSLEALRQTAQDPAGRRSGFETHLLALAEEQTRD